MRDRFLNAVWEYSKVFKIGDKAHRIARVVLRAIMAGNFQRAGKISQSTKTTSVIWELALRVD